MTKTCTKCRQAKPLEVFEIDKRNASGHGSWCKPCKRDNDRKRRATSAEKQRTNDYRKAVRSRPVNRARESRHAKAYRSRYPERDRAKRVLRTALANGTLIRPIACERCGMPPPNRADGRSGLHGHHSDYSLPLAVLWLCQSCHSEVHRARGGK